MVRGPTLWSPLFEPKPSLTLPSWETEWNIWKQKEIELSSCANSTTYFGGNLERAQPSSPFIDNASHLRSLTTFPDKPAIMRAIRKPIKRSLCEMRQSGWLCWRSWLIWKPINSCFSQYCESSSLSQWRSQKCFGRALSFASFYVCLTVKTIINLLFIFASITIQQA